MNQLKKLAPWIAGAVALLGAALTSCRPGRSAGSTSTPSGGCPSSRAAA